MIDEIKGNEVVKLTSHDQHSACLPGVIDVIDLAVSSVDMQNCALDMKL